MENRGERCSTAIHVRLSIIERLSSFSRLKMYYIIVEGMCSKCVIIEKGFSFIKECY